MKTFPGSSPLPPFGWNFCLEVQIPIPKEFGEAKLGFPSGPAHLTAGNSGLRGSRCLSLDVPSLRHVPIPSSLHPSGIPSAPRDLGQVSEPPAAHPSFSLPKGQSWRCPLTSSGITQEFPGCSFAVLLCSLGAAASEPCPPFHPNISSQIHLSRLEKEDCPASLGELSSSFSCTIPLTEGEAELPIP